MGVDFGFQDQMLEMIDEFNIKEVDFLFNKTDFFLRYDLALTFFKKAMKAFQ